MAEIAVLRALPGVGDLLCAVPALRAIRHAHPAARITLIGLPTATWFVERFRLYMDALLPLTVWPGLPETPGPPQDACVFLASARERRFDLALQLHGDGAVTNDLIARLGASRVGGMTRAGGPASHQGGFVPITDDTSEVDRMLAAVRAAGIPTPSAALEWPEWPLERRQALAVVPDDDRPYAVLHPGASLPSRRWDPSGFAAVGDHLASRGCSVVVTGVAAERGVAEAVRERMRHAVPIDLVGRCSLGATAAVVRRASVVVTNDTGMSHLAAAVGAPSVVVFSVTDPRRWKPPGDRHCAVVATELAPTIDHVLAALP
jgi:ADP-heptose:LPS heptosyltransferase